MDKIIRLAALLHHMIQVTDQCGGKVCLSNVFAEIIRLRDRSLPPFSIALSHRLLEQHKKDEDEETLEGHKDGEDVSEGKELFNFYHQNSNDPSDTHHHSQRDRYLQPMPFNQIQLL